MVTNGWHLLLVTWVVLMIVWCIYQIEGAARNERRTAALQGDIMIGALFSVHQSPGPKQAQTRTCGDVREQYGIQRVEAAFQSIDHINNDEKILPNISLGVEIRDSCWYSPIALEQSIEFIRDAIAMNDDVTVNASSTPGAEVHPECPRPLKQVKNLVGVIGPGSSTVTIQVQNLLQLFSIPQIGYSATSRDLSDKSFYKYFLRVVPSDFYQAQVMVDLVRRYNWTYVSAVHTDGNYGGSGMDAFTKLAHEAGICIAATDSIFSNAEDKYFDNIITNLQRYPAARVVVCFCEGNTVRGLLRATRRKNLTGEYLFIGSDGWSDRYDVTDEFEPEAKGGMSIRIHSTYDETFDPYYFQLDPYRNTRNPWFQEFWEFRFNCSLRLNQKSSTTKYNRTCTGREKLSDRYKQDTKMSFVKKAIYTMAYGLHNMQKALCPGQKGLCAAMLPINGSVFLQYLMNVTFSSGNETVEFDVNGDPPGRYDIMNFQFNNGSYDYVAVGTWIKGNLTIRSRPQWNLGHKSGLIPESVCSKPCEKGKVKSIQSESVKCCWVCVACKENQFLEDEYTCKDCDLGWWPNANLTGCDQIPVEYIQWTDNSALVAMTIACLGFIATFFAMVVFIQHNNTPVVKASTRELSYIILVGMYLCYGTTFALLAKPTHITCFITRVLPGLSFAMMYASLLTKTNRIARILAGSKKKIITKKPRFMSATAQVVITWILIAVEAGIIAGMLLWEPADSEYWYPTLYKVRLRCNTTPLGIIAPLGFDFFLIAMCTLYAVKTRNVPENFNEAKFIGFTMYTTIVIWMAFVPIYFGSTSKVITMCLCVSFSAIVALLLLFFPKLYIILFRPEKNNRSAFTTAKDVRCHIGYSSSGVSRNSNHSTSDYSLESPRNHSLDLVHKPQKNRRHSMNLFERFRINKQDKIAANVAQHIRAVRAAEALDRRTRLRRSDSFHLPDLPPQKSTSSGEDSPGCHEKRRLVGMLKKAYGREVEEIPGVENLTGAPKTEEAASQTSYDLLESLLPALRRRIVRSETVMTSLTPEDEDARGTGATRIIGSSCYHPLFGSGDKYRYHSVCGTNHASVNYGFDDPNGANYIGSRRTRHGRSPDDEVFNDRVEVEYKMDELRSKGLDEEDSDTISLQEMKRSKALSILSKRTQYNKLQRVSATVEAVPSERVDHPTAEGRLDSKASNLSQDSLIEATSSIVEESASTGSDDTSGSAVYKNIIISLGSPQDQVHQLGHTTSFQPTCSTASLMSLPNTSEGSEQPTLPVHPRSFANLRDSENCPPNVRWYPRERDVPSWRSEDDHSIKQKY